MNQSRLIDNFQLTNWKQVIVADIWMMYGIFLFIILIF